MLASISISIFIFNYLYLHMNISIPVDMLASIEAYVLACSPNAKGDQPDACRLGWTPNRPGPPP